MKRKIPQSGFFYTVSEAQISEHKKRSIKDIFLWIESTNKFVKAIRQPDEEIIAQHFSKKIAN